MDADKNSQEIEPTQNSARQSNSDLPKKSHVGMIVTIIIIIVICIASIAGTYYYMSKKAADQKKQQDAQIQELKDKINELQKQTTSTTTTPQAADPTTSWKLLQSSQGKYSIKYPSDWVTKNCGSSVSNFIAETTALLAICSTDKISQITIQSESGDVRNSPNGNLTDAQYFTYEEKPVEVNGVKGIRRVSTVKSSTDYQFPAGSRFIYYIFYTSGRTYLIDNYQYTENQAGALKYPDITSTFDTMVQKTLKFQ